MLGKVREHDMIQPNGLNVGFTLLATSVSACIEFAYLSSSHEQFSIPTRRYLKPIDERHHKVLHNDKREIPRGRCRR
jgi:hypothetical protein